MSLKFAYAQCIQISDSRIRAEYVEIESPLGYGKVRGYLARPAQAEGKLPAVWPPYEAALKAAGIQYVAYIYPGVQHGFNNDTTPRYDEAAASLAWLRIIGFFKTNLKI